MSYVPQTGQVWYWTSKRVSQFRHVYGSDSGDDNPVARLALSKTPIVTTSIAGEESVKRARIVYVISPGQVPRLTTAYIYCLIPLATARGVDPKRRYPIDNSLAKPQKTIFPKHNGQRINIEKSNRDSRE